MSRDQSRRQPITDIPDNADGDYFVWFFYDSMSGPLKAITVTTDFLPPEKIAKTEYSACRWEGFTSGEEAYQRASKLFHLFRAQIESDHPDLPAITAECDQCGHSSGN